MFMGLLIALLGAAMIYVSIITLAWLFNVIEKKIKKYPGTLPITGDLEELLSSTIKDSLDGKQKVSLKELQIKIKEKALVQANVDNEGNVKDIEIINSDKRDNELEELLEENNGLIQWTA